MGNNIYHMRDDRRPDHQEESRRTGQEGNRRKLLPITSSSSASISSLSSESCRSSSPLFLSFPSHVRLFLVSGEGEVEE